MIGFYTNEWVTCFSEFYSAFVDAGKCPVAEPHVIFLCFVACFSRRELLQVYSQATAGERLQFLLLPTSTRAISSAKLRKIIVVGSDEKEAYISIFGSGYLIISYF